MKNLQLLCISLFSLITVQVFSQQNCKVLQSDINTEYQGECSKGLAHGKGVAKGINTYDGQFKKGFPNGKGLMKYADGSSYLGDWKNGLRNGEGTFIQLINSKDSIAEGIWKNDKYVGKKKVKEYDVIKKIAVPRYTIRKISDDFDKVTVRVKTSGMYVSTTKNINGTSGNLVFNQGKAIFENISYYPFTCDMKYDMPNKLGTSSYNVEFSFKIFVKGDWLVEIYH